MVIMAHLRKHKFSKSTASMANRLSIITTRTGDDGSTGLGDGTRTQKDSLRIDVIGEIDELNSSIGVVLAEPLADQVRDVLVRIQHDLFDLGGELSIPGREALTDTHLTRLDESVATLNASLAPLKEFILPGGYRAAALCHMARTTCRRTERKLTALAAVEKVNSTSQKYLNRLSDLLFVLCRIINRDAGVAESYWHPGRNT